MKRTVIFLVLFLLLGGLAAWYLSSDQAAEKATVVGWDRDFAVEDIEEVHRIFIARRDGAKTRLEREGDHWVYNGKYKANPAVMRPLLDAIEKVRMRYKPANAAVENMVNHLATKGIKVELYNKAGENLKTYYLGGSTQDGLGTYMIMEGAEQPYVVELPAWEGNISVRFSHVGDEWRDKSIFDEELEDIQSLSVEYPKQKNQSFRIEARGSSYELSPFYEITPEITRPQAEGSIENYLSGFERVIAEGFRNDYSKKDSVRQLIPFSIITLANKSGDSTQARFFTVEEPDKIFQDPSTGEYVRSKPKFERFYVDLNGEDFLQTQQLPIQQIFWGYPSFFEETPLQ